MKPFSKHKHHKKILFLTKSIPVYGGVERWLADLVYGLERQGYKCLVALAKGYAFHNPENYRAAYPELKTHDLDCMTGSQVGREMAIEKALKKYQPNYVVPVMLADGLSVSAQMKNSLGYKLIYPIHEINEGVVNDISRFSNYIDTIVYVDHFSKNYYQKYLNVSQQTELIPCGVPEARAARIDSEIVRLGFCGRIVSEKRVMDLLPLCEILDNTELQYSLSIFGAGDRINELENAFSNKLVFSNRVSNDVAISKPVDRDDLYETFYNNIDILIITSEAETGPLVAFEAMVNGVVVITSDFSGRAENASLIDNKNCMVFPIGVMSKAAELIKEVASKPELKLRLQQTAYQYLSDSRSLVSMIDSWNEMLLTSNQDIKVTNSMKSNKLGYLNFIFNSHKLIELLRKLFNRKYIHSYASEEWPYYCNKRIDIITSKKFK